MKINLRLIKNAGLFFYLKYRLKSLFLLSGLGYDSSMQLSILKLVKKIEK